MDQPFEVDVQKSRRKSAVIYVRNGRVEVRVPMRTPNYWVNEFVQSRQQWIEQQLQRDAKRRAEHYQLSNGSKISFLGRSLTIISSNNTKVRLTEDELALPDDNRNKAFKAWLKAEADAYMSPLAQERLAAIGADVLLQKIRFRFTRSRWGHCTRDGIVQFSPLIMLAPPHAVDYLVCHELSHLVHMNHSRAFWALVDSICPHRQDAQQWLKANEHKLLALH